MEKIEKARHTLSHVLAAAVKELYPEVKFGIGPAIEDGFYYDIDFGKTKLSEADLPKIEKKMRGIINRGFEMKRREESRKNALKWAADGSQTYKTELIEDLPADEKISFYDLVVGSDVLFSDLCKGPHVAKSSEIGAFKLTKVAGAYWRGDE